VGIGAAAANDLGRAVRGVRSWNGTGQQWTGNRHREQCRFHHLPPSKTPTSRRAAPTQTPIKFKTPASDPPKTGQSKSNPEKQRIVKSLLWFSGFYPKFAVGIGPLRTQDDG
jgi:hypothetical protein